MMWERGGVMVDAWQEWTQFARRCNWYTFRLVMLEFENDTQLGAVEFTVVLLGFGLRVRWTHTRTELAERLERQVAEVMEGRE